MCVLIIYMINNQHILNIIELDENGEWQYTDEYQSIKCDHHFDWGHPLEPIFYCTKCGKELDQCGYDLSILRTHKIINGELVKNPKYN